MHKVLFVCLGNICRSPTAHGVFASKVESKGWNNQFTIDSCGTGDWHIGHAPDDRAQAAALKMGYDLSNLRARQFSSADLEAFDWVFAMDNNNLRDIAALRTQKSTAETRLFLEYAFEELNDNDLDSWQLQYEFARKHHFEVPDPYYGGEGGFADVIKLIDIASELILRRLTNSC